jgi:glycine dehydrogenase subunit 1
VNIDKTGKKIDTVHKRLLSQHGVHGGKNISKEFPELGQTALYCVTEVQSKDDIDSLATGLGAILGAKR